MGPSMLSGGSRHHVSLGWVRHDEALTKMAAACWSRDRFTDVTIFCEDRALQAHRLVLASMSPLLANLLAEAEGPDTALMLPEVKAEDMRLLLQFIYQGEVVLPPRRTAALLDLAAQLCVAGVRGGGGPTPPSPPRSDSPELDSCDANAESDQVSEDEHPNEPESHKMDAENNNPVEVDGDAESDCHVDPVNETNESDKPEANEDQDMSRDDDKHEDSDDESGEEGPMDLAKPEVRVNGTSCPRPKPCSSSPPDFNYFSSSNGNSNNLNNHNNRLPFATRFTDSRNAALSYYQHPALRGCHPFSLELAVNHRNNGSRTPDGGSRPKRKHNYGREVDNNSGDSDVEVTVDISVDEYDSDREIDLSLKPDVNRLRPDSAGDEKLSPSSDLDNSSASSSESMEHLKGRGAGLYLHPSNGGSGSVADMRLSLADKMLLLPPGAGSNHHADPRRTYLEAVLQESLVQQSYTIVLPSHLSASLPMNADQLGSTSNSGNLLSASSLEGKAWNLAGKNSAAAAAAELQCLQGLFGSRVAAGGGSEANFGRNSAAGSLSMDENGKNSTPTNLSTNKNANGSNSCTSSTSNNSKRNGKEGYSCQVCRKTFTSSSNLAVHSMIHSGTKPFKCDLCSWSFRQKAHLQKHMRHIHKIIVAK